jgi:hypothetical protein
MDLGEIVCEALTGVYGCLNGISYSIKSNCWPVKKV